MFLTRSGICLRSRVVCDLYVVPEQPVVSYLTPLTGVDEATLAERGTTLDEALTTLRSKLAPNITLVVSSGWGSGLRPQRFQQGFLAGPEYPAGCRVARAAGGRGLRLHD